MANARRRPSRARERERLLDAARRTRVPDACDVCVIGGGAAGICAAIAAAEAGAEVVALERDPSCCRTILATGNGRCNLSNSDLSPIHYNQPELARAVMGEPADALAAVLGFFEESGLACSAEDGRWYPRSRSAASVRDVLLSRAGRAGVTLAAAREVTGARRTNADPQAPWQVTYRQSWDDAEETLRCRSLVLASGGGTVALARALGLPCEPEQPVLCALACEPREADLVLDTQALANLPERLDGRRAAANATLLRNGEAIFHERGEVLFRPFGLSGIVTFDLSRHARPVDVVTLDLLDDVDDDAAAALLRNAGTAGLHGLLDPQVADALLAAADGDARQALRLARTLAWQVTGPADIAHAQVTRGGVRADALDPETLGVLAAPGLHCCGEAVDMDGACGGYNLSWAWLSGLCAGRAAAVR